MGAGVLVGPQIIIPAHRARLAVNVVVGAREAGSVYRR